MARIQIELEVRRAASAFSTWIKRVTTFATAVVHANRPHGLDNHRRHGLQQGSRVGARPGASKQFSHLAIEAAGNAQTDQLAVMPSDRRTSSMRMCPKLDVGIGDLQIIDPDPQDHRHVMDLEWVRIIVDIYAWRLHVLHRTNNNHVVIVSVHLGVITAGVQQRELFERDCHGHLDI